MATGGAEKLLHDAIPALNKSGVTTDLLLLNGTSQPFLKALQEHNDFNIYTLTKGSVYNPLLIIKIIPFLRKYDIAHVHLFPALYFVVFAKLVSFSRIKLLYTEHSTSNKRRNNTIFKLFDRFVYRRYEYIVTISTEVKLLLKKHLGKTQVQFRTINNGVAIDFFANTLKSKRTDYGISNDTKIIIHVARFTHQKDQDTLIRSVSYIQGPVVLLLVGEGYTKPKMEELVETLDLKDKVQFLGVRTDVASLLSMADVAVLSSNHEGLSLSSLEAMASGTPLVASNVTGLKNLVHGAGVLFQHKDEIDLANKVTKLLTNPSHYTETVKTGLKRVSKFTLEEMIVSHINLYKEVCLEKN